MKTIEMVRKIREKQAQEIENKSQDEIIAYFRKKAEKLHERMERTQKIVQLK